MSLTSTANDGYRCKLCGAWIEYRDLGKVLAHEGPLPHPDAAPETAYSNAFLD
jgi:hypothetical protein